MEVIETAPPPVAPALPLPQVTAGTIIGRTFSVWGQNAVAFSIVMLVLYVPVLAVQLWLGPSPQFTPGVTAPGAMMRYQAGAFGLVLLSMVLNFATMGALTRGVLQSLDGRRPGAGELLAFGFRKLWPVSVTAMNASVRMVLWSLLLIVPGIMAGCRLFVAVPARVAEPHLGSNKALARSRELTLGRRNAIFLSLIVVMVVGTLVNLGVSLIGLRRGLLPFAVATTIVWAVNAVANGLYPTAAGVTYHDLRLEKDGADTAQLARVFE